jgi:hypothetical protein
MEIILKSRVPYLVITTKNVKIKNVKNVSFKRLLLM